MPWDRGRGRGMGREGKGKRGREGCKEGVRWKTKREMRGKREGKGIVNEGKDEG